MVEGRPSIFNGRTDLVKWLTFVILAIGTIITIVLWAVTQHSDLREWVADADHSIKIESQEYVKDRCVSKEAFSALKAKLEANKEEINRLRNGRSKRSKVHALAPGDR